MEFVTTCFLKAQHLPEWQEKELCGLGDKTVKKAHNFAWK